MSISLGYKYSPGNTLGDDPKLRGEPDKSLFNRNEYHEVYYLVKKFCEKFSGVTAMKTEELIHKHLPGEVRSQENVIEWLRVNYNKH